jgi:hypothetical protein
MAALNGHVKVSRNCLWLVVSFALEKVQNININIEIML